jgi:hemolysin activation/secretion protein
MQWLPETRDGLNGVTVDTSRVVQGLGDRKITVSRFRVTGAELFSHELLEGLLSDYVGRALNSGELYEAAQRITAYYARHRFLARAVVPEQDVRDGEVRIHVIEAKLGKVEVTEQNCVRLGRDRAAAYVTGAQAPGEQIRIDDLERGLLLLQGNCGAVSSATVHRGQTPGTSDVSVNLDKSPLVGGEARFENFGGLATGEYRGNATVNLNSPLGIGDRLSLRAMYTDGISYGRAQYAVPVGTHGLTAGVSGSWLGYRLGGDFKVLDATGESVTAGGSLSMPLILRRRSNLFCLLGYEYRHFTDKISSLTYGDKSERTGTLSVGGGWFDDVLGGGFTTVYSMLTIGNLDLSKIPAAASADRQGAQAAGDYRKLNLSLSRIQRLFSTENMLTISMTGQVAGSNLDSSEKFILGGVYGVRAYPQGEAPGDQGLLVSAELHHAFSPVVDLFGFYDCGTVRQHVDLNPPLQRGMRGSNVYSLDGIGAGVLLKPAERFIVKGMVATRLRSNPAPDLNGNDHDGSRRQPRFWVDVSYQF